MHPEVIQERPGMCPICGMALVPAKPPKKIPTEHDKHKGHKKTDFLVKFYVTLALTIPILLYSDVIMMAFGWNAPRFPGVDYLMFVLGSVVFFYGGGVFLTSAYRELRARLPGMMTLIAIAITAAYGFSAYVTFAGGAHTLFWELATLIAVMLIGHYIEMRAVQGAKGALRELARLLPDMAEKLTQNSSAAAADKTQSYNSKLKTNSEIVPISELKEGDMVLVRPGAKVPADGKIIEGQSELNESIITGESKPAVKKAGDEVIAGSINGDGSLIVQVTKIGENTFLAGIMRLVAEAEASKSRLQMLSDRAAFYLAIIAVVGGLMTLLVWLFLGKDAFFAVERVVAVLVIACPHALGLAIPLVASISTTMGAKNGLLVRRRLALEEARNINIVLFDKTGTLTKGEFGVYSILPSENHSEEEVLRLAASINSRSEHPLAKAILAKAEEKNISLASISDFERVAGKGAKAQVGDSLAAVGNRDLMADFEVRADDYFAGKVSGLEKQGKTVVHVAKGRELIGSIALADMIRPESKDAIKKLKEMGIRSAMITGDSEDVAKWVAGELGLDQYFARVLPEEKSDKVKLLQEQGMKVAMVGDGINDAPALTQSDLGVAIGAGTNVAIESAGIVLVKSDPGDIPKIIKLSRLTYVKMIQNIFWAAGYNIVAMPIAAGALYAQGIVLNPAVAAVFMSLSTVIVAINAVLLRRRSLG
ncbi:heavy metal translocating P-type ATPase [Candidatus Parcubacteria bacterium]|nr:MAG: heavy metal translocating P-type ATPase [Candidatus Parcubacteria bacterium]